MQAFARFLLHRTFCICLYGISFLLLCAHGMFASEKAGLQDSVLQDSTTQSKNPSQKATQPQKEKPQTKPLPPKDLASLESLQKDSIIADLRTAFSPYSTLEWQYKDIMDSYNMLDNETQSSELFRNASLHGQRLFSYTHFLELLSSVCCHLIDSKDLINSFDLEDFVPELEQVRFKVTSLKSTESFPKELIEKAQTESDKESKKSIKKPHQVISQKIDIALLAPKCVGKKFSITKEEKLKTETLLQALAKECDFSIQYIRDKKVVQDSANAVLHIQNKPLDFVLSLLLGDMFYTIESHRLIIEDIVMQMFVMNYISSTRMAQSNTDVLFAQEQENYGYMGYNGNFNNYNSMIPNYSLWQNGTQNTPAQNQSFYNPSMSGYLDNLSLRNQLRSQMSVANARFGKSGTKVYSVDEINFWADIESKMNVMLDIRYGDRFMIDKGAGIIAVWTTKRKMREVARFLQSLEEKMNLQVALDVEILSLTHFQTNNVGINWQEIFSILNPTKSSLNLAFGAGAATLTLGNDNTDLQSIFNLLRTYGELRSLSNPKIMALNNQPALISVGSVLRYTQNLVYQSNNTNTTIQNTSTQYPSVFAGILLDITPSISDDSVILRINPSITKTKDPTMENAAQALNSPPNLSTNQLSSIVKLRDGERVIIGGLLSNVMQNTTQAIPRLGERGWLKSIFGKQSNINRSEELIIIITPHIVR